MLFSVCKAIYSTYRLTVKHLSIPHPSGVSALSSIQRQVGVKGQTQYQTRQKSAFTICVCAVQATAQEHTSV